MRSGADIGIYLLNLSPSPSAGIEPKRRHCSHDALWHMCFTQLMHICLVAFPIHTVSPIHVA
jgi:hypothetical protein